MTTAILGAGISGLAASHHLGHESCRIYEASSHYGGHVFSEQVGGFTWDDGPHVSYTDNEYVRTLLAENIDDAFEEHETCVSNYYRGHWIEHPAQTHLYQVPEPLRTECLNSFLETRSAENGEPQVRDYQQWIDYAFGPVFAENFPAAYTRKYWTTEPTTLGIDWIGKRVYFPKVEDVVDGATARLDRSTYWVTKWRYPEQGGFLSYLHRFVTDGSRIVFEKRLTCVDLRNRTMEFADGTREEYGSLVSTIPLPVLIECCTHAPDDVREAAAALRCTEILLVRVGVNHPSRRKEQWMYVYDEDKLTTRISIQEHFATANAPASSTGISVEVYGSTYRPLPEDRDAVCRTVQKELVDMGLVDGPEAIVSTHVRYVPWGNVIYDHNRRPALNLINEFLDAHGVVRVGRFAQWGYLMTHDCVLQSRVAAERVRRGEAHGSDDLTTRR